MGLIAEEVSKKQKDCEEDLAKAEPALAAAQEALNTLNKVTGSIFKRMVQNESLIICIHLHTNRCV